MCLRGEEESTTTRLHPHGAAKNAADHSSRPPWAEKRGCCIIIADDDARAASILEARLSSWGLHAVTAHDREGLLTLLQRYTEALVCYPRRWQATPGHAILAWLNDHLPVERRLAYGADLWATDCPSELRRHFSGALDWAVHHG